ncbi:hypothetical protein [Streptosporangium subroseum]|uniref:hypothetical protein n=1 Tax=Streptosporangium subroseum TaxID=106412 RepID=UPI00308CFFB8|nr:hypothetical protein OHB15_14015 [Streptosporangium subroseum]
MTGTGPSLAELIEQSMDESALASVIKRIKDIVYSDTFGGVFNCATCGDMVYGIDDGDWLECMVSKAFDHKCKKD